ncbi:MAG: hypothetical protein HC910_08970 [Spirulinaceae cyanobacterium SM2_1_0]|nr:hypothetical protein [Spirulinaceae cyanobacterium SM2_1_0]
MAFIQAEELKALVASADQPCVSIYFPTTRPGQDAHQNLIRLKNRVTAVETQLCDRDWRAAQIDELLQPLRRALPDDNTNFWKQQTGGLVAFLAPSRFYYNSLPLDFEPLSIVAERFYIKPLLPLFTEREPFYMLAIAKNSLRLLWCDQQQSSEVDLSDLPLSLAAALRFDDPEKQLQFHSSQGGGRAPVYHGHGRSGTDDKDDLRRWFQQVDAVLGDRYQDRPAPLVLAGVEYLTALYRELSAYPDLMSESINGNPEAVTATELGEQAQQLLQPRQARRYQEMVSRYRELLGTGQATADVQAVMNAALRGQVETLFVPRRDQLWGRMDPDTGQIILDNTDHEWREDLANLAAVCTFQQGGSVYVVDADAMPSPTAAAAILRYPVMAGQPSR